MSPTEKKFIPRTCWWLVSRIDVAPSMKTTFASTVPMLASLSHINKSLFALEIGRPRLLIDTSRFIHQSRRDILPVKQRYFGIRYGWNESTEMNVHKSLMLRTWEFHLVIDSGLVVSLFASLSFYCDFLLHSPPQAILSSENEAISQFLIQVVGTGLFPESLLLRINPLI